MVMAMDLILIAVTAILLVGEGNTQALPPLQPPIQSPQAACSDGDATALWYECRMFFYQPGPNAPLSSLCCAALQQIGMDCFCSRITKDLENSISLEKVVEMANDCGNPLKHGTQCGNIKFKQNPAASSALQALPFSARWNGDT
ncbi:hypothetical protein Pint_30933 [Pistacia integerrima]|uniref:Uncharacterized protein n=1 Tax=Pistacia integerrima TaxID=434235 RepID=A0ACC0XQS1_9ROSI|nr:hypothetical protein Pint_30933 [Pistacia integerrima]